MPEWNDGYECRVYVPYCDTSRLMLDENGNTPMGEMVLIKRIKHKPRPGKHIAHITEEELDLLINGETRQSKYKTKDKL